MNREYFKKYLNQEESLPVLYLQYIKEITNENILFYTLSDLDYDFKLSVTWIVLTQSNLFILNENEKKIIDLEVVGKITQQSGKVANCFSLLDKDEKLLEYFWFGQRQNILLAQLKYLLEQKIKGEVLILDRSADELYASGTLKPLLKKQSGKDTGKRKVVWRLLGYIKPYRKELYIGGLGAVGMTIVSLLPAYISGRLIDDIIRPYQDGKISSDEALKIGWLVIGALASSYALKEVFVWVRLKKMSIMGEKIARDLRAELYNHLQTLEMDFFSEKQTGSIISRVSSDTDRIWDFVAFGIVEVSISIIMLTGLSLVLIGMDPMLGMIMTIPVPIMIFAIYKHGQKMQNLFLKCWRKWSELTGVLSDTIPGIQVVKSFNQEEREKKRFGAKNDAALDVFVGVHHSWTKFWPLLMLSIQVVMLSVWIFAMPRLMSVEESVQHLSAGTFVAFLLYMTMFSGPIEIIGQMARMMNRATSSAYRIFEILDTPSSLKKTGNEAVNKFCNCCLSSPTRTNKAYHYKTY
jgi:ATP-binding cassette subfamily B protein